jgi:hypothetical protein
MPLHSVPESELREHCRRAIEGLELWLRRLVNDKFMTHFGVNYVEATTSDGSRLIRAKLSQDLKQRMANEPTRFSRLVDAAFLEDLIDLICNPMHYNPIFKDTLADAFPQGASEARALLQRLVPPRNALYHANPISVHDAYRVLCYTADVAAALQNYYVRSNMAQQYNVPTVIRIVDSLGHRVDLSTSSGRVAPEMRDYSQDHGSFLSCGSTISIEIDVDPAFDPAEYEIWWSVSNVGGPNITSRKFVLFLEDRYVSTRLCIVCQVISRKSWHKFGTHDDQVEMCYRVLPPTA